MAYLSLKGILLEEDAFSSLMESNLLISENEANKRIDKFFNEHIDVDD